MRDRLTRRRGLQVTDLAITEGGDIVSTSLDRRAPSPQRRRPFRQGCSAQRLWLGPCIIVWRAVGDASPSVHGGSAQRPHRPGMQAQCARLDCTPRMRRRRRRPARRWDGRLRGRCTCVARRPDPPADPHSRARAQHGARVARRRLRARAGGPRRRGAVRAGAAGRRPAHRLQRHHPCACGAAAPACTRSPATPTPCGASACAVVCARLRSPR